MTIEKQLRDKFEKILAHYERENTGYYRQSCLDALLKAALHSLSSPKERESIETAPKDGTEILAAIKYPADHVVREIEKCHARVEQEILLQVIFWRDGKWRTLAGGCWPPFMWQTLPPTQALIAKLSPIAEEK